MTMEPGAHRDAPTGAIRVEGDGHRALPAGDAGAAAVMKRRSPTAPGVTVTDITSHGAFLPHHDPDASLAFCRDTLGFGVGNDVGYGGMRWITVGPAEEPGTSISGLPVRLRARQDTPGRCDPRPQE